MCSLYLRGNKRQVQVQCPAQGECCTHADLVHYLECGKHPFLLEVLSRQLKMWPQVIWGNLLHVDDGLRMSGEEKWELGVGHWNMPLFRISGKDGLQSIEENQSNTLSRQGREKKSLKEVVAVGVKCCQDGESKMRSLVLKRLVTFQRKFKGKLMIRKWQ